MRPHAILALLTAQTAVFVVLGLGLWVWSGRSAGTFVTFGGDEFAIGLALAGALILLAALTFYGLPKLSEYLVRAQADNFSFLEKPLPFPAIIWVSLGAGIGEEALFRGGVQTLAGDYIGAPLAIVLAAALFAAVHFAKPLVAAIIFVIGVLFGVVYWQTGSLLAVMIGHALYDVFALWYVQKEMHRLGVFAPQAKE
ncbi:CPBP family intramembrane glutamic endopeptidase [Citromicrobium bathyomarinum]|uniref:CPBP family intramembrane glutamic endopeptidase n=1 Tax=Citromicrobium bathyomarinum TaxID=72174 RepID=UPI00315A26CC